MGILSQSKTGNVYSGEFKDVKEMLVYGMVKENMLPQDAIHLKGVYTSGDIYKTI